MKKIKPETVKKIRGKLDFEIGKTEKELGEIFKFTKGTYIKLDDSQKGVIGISMNGITLGSGRLLTQEGKLFVQITDLKKK